MQNLQVLDTTVLIDLLASHTADYIRMVREGASEEDFARCNLYVRAIQTEINARKLKVGNTSTSDSVGIVRS